MFRTLICFLLPLFSFGFNPFLAINNRILIRGSTKPLENFDPLNLGTDESRLVFFREAELKHGRLAMVASLLIPFLDTIDENVLGIYGFQHFPKELQISLVSLMFISEFASMTQGWEKPWVKPFALKTDYQPGDLGFKLQLKSDDEENGILMDKELNNGRLAMIGALGMIGQQLATGQHLF
jgi:hypothetical protein